MTDFKHIDDARRLLGLEEDASLSEIKKAYRSLAHEYHPDTCKDEKKQECEETFKKISNAKDLLMNYCAGYRYSFREKDVKRNTMDRGFYKYLKRFYDGWWGDLDV